MNSFENNNYLSLENFSYWENKKLYIQLMEKFVNNRMDARELDTQISRIWRVDRDKNYSSQEVLQKLQMMDGELTKLKGFSNLISDCDVFQSNSNLREDYEISEEELRSHVKKILLEINDLYT